MEAALHDLPLFCGFAGLNSEIRRLDESTILRFRHLLGEHNLAPKILGTVSEVLQGKGLLLKFGTAVDATLITAPSSTKNASAEHHRLHRLQIGEGSRALDGAHCVSFPYIRSGQQAFGVTKPLFLMGILLPAQELRVALCKKFGCWGWLFGSALAFSEPYALPSACL